MSTNLTNVFKNVDLQRVGKTVSNIVSLAFKPNKKTGARIARAVLDDGTTLIKTVTASGVVSETFHHLPEITSVIQRNEVIKDLYKQKINQETIAAMLDISQSTVSNVLRKK
jgi:DNA-directed RNA polymerase specialized sigma subunit